MNNRNPCSEIRFLVQEVDLTCKFKGSEVTSLVVMRLLKFQCILRTCTSNVFSLPEFGKNTTFIIFVFILASFVSNAQESKDLNNDYKPLEFPVITGNSNDGLYVGKSDDIKTLVDKRKDFIGRLSVDLIEQAMELKSQIEGLQKKVEKDEDGKIISNLTNQELNKTQSTLKSKHDRILEIVNNFKDINYKYVVLFQEIDKVDTAEIPVAFESPYTIATITKLNNYIEEMQKQQEYLQTLYKQSTQRLSNLSTILNDFVIEYTILLSDTNTPLKTFDLIGGIYLYQADYAILKLRNDKYFQQLENTVNEVDLKQKMFTTVLEAITIEKEDLEELSDNLQRNKAESDELIAEHEKLNKDFDKSSLQAELALDKLEIKIKNTIDKESYKILKIQKLVNLNKIQYAYFIKNLLHQKEQTLQTTLNSNEFQLAWLNSYRTKEEKPEVFKNVIKMWQSKFAQQAKIVIANGQLLDSLTRSTLEISQMQQQIPVSDITSTEYIKHKKLLKKQLDKNLKGIQKLSIEITKNNDLIAYNNSKNSRTLSVLSKQLNKIELIGQWFGDKFSSQFDKAKGVLYYPIASFGDKAFNLAIILKILLYIILGFTFLRFFRKRLTHFLTKRTKLSEGAAHSISTLLYYFGGFLVFLAALSAAGFNLGQMMLVFGALGVGIGFGLQNIANNFISGMILLIDRTLTVGDSITLSDGTHGKVAKLAMRYTVIRTNGGYDIIVPNSELIANRVTSMTFADNYLRIEIPFGVSYNSDPEQVKEITLEVANNIKHTINRESQKSAVLFNGMGDNSLDFVLRVWVFIYDRYRPYAIKSDYYYKLFKAFKEADIEIPFPQRDLHIRSIDKEALGLTRKEYKSTSDK